MVVLLLTPVTGIALGDQNSGVYVSEILVSPNNENYGGTDWNCDGTFGSYSDQFIELHNPTASTIDIGGWTLEDQGADSVDSFSIPTGTTIEAGSRIVFFRADTGIGFDYFEGGSARLIDTSSAMISSLSFGGNDSDWDTSYVSDSSGSVSKVSPPTPGWGPGEDQPSTGPGAPCPDFTGVSHSGSYVLSGTVVTMESESSVLLNGHVLVIDGMISAVWSEGQTMPTAAEGVEQIETGGIIYPGLLDVHNHPHYNAIPIWDHGTDGWNNRYEWRTETAYKNAITKVENGLNDGGSDGCSLMVESMKHAEVKSIVGGTTVIQGATSENEATFDSILARNLEKTNFGEDRIETRVGGSWFPTDYSGSHVKSKKAAGTLDAWMIHLSEGIDEPSRAEFDSLVNNQLVIDELIVIHGTALTSTEFALMGQVDASLVWSPMSNLLLYGDTANIVAADDAGVSISISPDWGPSGAKSVLHEVKIADWWDSNVLGDQFSDYEMAQMITTNSVDQVGWTDKVGRIKPGLAADFLVLDSFASNPYRNLIEAVDPDVRLVVVDGFALFGDVDLMQKMTDDTEIINAPDFQKGIDIRFDGVPSGTQTYATVEQKLKDCLDNLSIGPRPFDPWYTFGDDRYFDVLNRSLTFQKDRTVDLWSDYYDINLDEHGNRTDTDSSDPSTWIGVGEGGGSGAASSDLIRIMMVPNEAEVTGLHVNSLGNLFVNAMHPSEQHYDATVGVINGVDWNSLPDIVPELELSSSEWDIWHGIRVSHGEYQVIVQSGDALSEGGVAGGIYAADDGELLFTSQKPDFNAFVPLNPQGTNGYLYTAWESRPAGVSQLEIQWNEGSLEWDVLGGKMLDLSEINGGWVLCFGSISPWGSPLLSEELYFPETKNWNDASYNYHSDQLELADYLGNYPNPYDYGWIVEIDEADSISPSFNKQFAMGRFSHENAQVMPDEKTVYLSDDGYDTVLFKFIADTAGDLESGTLFAAKVTQDSGINPGTTGFDVEWLELASSSDAEIESWIDDYDDIKTSDFVSGENSYISDQEINDWAESVLNQDLDGDGEVGTASDDRVAFLESRKAAAALGATDEWNKMEGVVFNPEAPDFVYLAMSDIKDDMTDSQGDIKLSENRCGIVYRMPVEFDWDVSRIEPVIVGGTYSSGSCDPNKIAGPDNLAVLDDGRVLVAEDTGKHDNNMLWLWTPPVDDVKENNSISQNDLPLLLPTFGPFGGVQHPANSSIEKGIHIEECLSNPEIRDDGRVRGCGSLVILLSSGEGCFVESQNMGISLEYMSDCVGSTSWKYAHPEISESSFDGDWPVSRLDPSYSPGDAITFPGRNCEDPIVMYPLILGDEPPNRGDDVRLGEWFCRDASNWMIPIEIEDEETDPQGEEVSALTEEVWYWIAIIVALAILIGSVVVIVRMTLNTPEQFINLRDEKNRSSNQLEMLDENESEE